MNTFGKSIGGPNRGFSQKESSQFGTETVTRIKGQ